MKITKMVINNFRLLKSTEIDLEKELSLIIGKNNCGKTSILTVLTKFLGEQSSTNNFNYDDFNIDFQKELFQCVDKNVGTWQGRTCQGIELYIFKLPTTSSTGGLLSALIRAIITARPEGRCRKQCY